MRRTTISLAVSQLLLAIALPVQAATLAWKFTPGDVQNYRLTQSSRLSGGAADTHKQLASIEQALDLTWKVLEVNDADTAKISLEVTAFSLLAKGPDGQEVRFDSESTEEPQGYAAMLVPIGKRLAESPIVFTMNSQGEVTDIQLPDELAEAVKSVPGGKKYAQDGGLASVEALARLGAPLDLPKGDVNAEQVWTAEREVAFPVLGSAKVEFSYKIAEPISADEITIEQQMKIESAAGEEVAKFMNQQSAGSVVFDAESGRPETSVLSFEVEIDQSGSADGATKLEQHTEFRRIADETQ
jgi:hypothetical protein